LNVSSSDPARHAYQFIAKKPYFNGKWGKIGENGKGGFLATISP